MGKWLCHINKSPTIHIVSLPSSHTRNIFKVTFIHFIQCLLLHPCWLQKQQEHKYELLHKAAKACVDASVWLQKVSNCLKQNIQTCSLPTRNIMFVISISVLFSVFIMDKLASLATAKEQNRVSKYFECVTHEWL